MPVSTPPGVCVCIGWRVSLGATRKFTDWSWSPILLMVASQVWPEKDVSPVPSAGFLYIIHPQLSAQLSIFCLWRLPKGTPNILYFGDHQLINQFVGEP